MSTTTPEKPVVHRLAYSPRDAATALGVSRSSLYELLKLGDIAAKKVGNRTLILVSELDRFISGLPSK